MPDPKGSGIGHFCPAVVWAGATAEIVGAPRAGSTAHEPVDPGVGGSIRATLTSPLKVGGLTPTEFLFKHGTHCHNPKEPQ